MTTGTKIQHQHRTAGPRCPSNVRPAARTDGLNANACYMHEHGRNGVGGQGGGGRTSSVYCLRETRARVCSIPFGQFQRRLRRRWMDVDGACAPLIPRDAFVPVHNSRYAVRLGGRNEWSGSRISAHGTRDMSTVYRHRA